MIESRPDKVDINWTFRIWQKLMFSFTPTTFGFIPWQFSLFTLTVCTKTMDRAYFEEEAVQTWFWIMTRVKIRPKSSMKRWQPLTDAGKAPDLPVSLSRLKGTNLDRSIEKAWKRNRARQSFRMTQKAFREIPADEPSPKLQIRMTRHRTKWNDR